MSETKILFVYLAMGIGAIFFLGLALIALAKISMLVGVG